jgi:hypothetical protein
MALDLHILEDGRHTQLLYQIEHEQYERLHPALKLLQKRTGIFLDEYSDTKFVYDLKPLIQVLQDSLSVEQDHLTKQNLSSLLSVLSEAEAKKISLIFVGD